MANLVRYLLLLERWNRVYNLTAVREVERMVPLHVLDSLSVASYVHGPNVLDVGSGGGPSQTRRINTSRPVPPSER